MTVSSEDCKKAIVNTVLDNPGLVAKNFVNTSGYEAHEIDDFEAGAMKTKNWKRFEKEVEPNGLTRRGFDCKPYDDQLRAYTWDNGDKILKVSIEGE